MQPLHALKTPGFVSYLTIVNTGIGTRVPYITPHEYLYPFILLTTFL